MIFQGYLFSIVYAVLVLALGLALYKLRCPKKVTRKIVHILIGFEWVILYRFFGGGIHFLFVCLLFLGILLISYRKRLLPMIESDSDNSPGTVYYALAMSIMALITVFVPDMTLPFGIGVFCTSLGDGFAGLLGQLMNTPSNGKIYGNKTIYGTLYNAIICFIVAGVMNAKFDMGMADWHIVAIALFATLLELFATKGLDNITVTLGASFLSYFFIHFDRAENYIIPIILTPIMIAFASKKQALTSGGIIAAIIVDIIISISLGNFGFVILFSFFTLGLITDKIKKQHKNKGRKTKKFGKSNPRDHRQVLANSLAAAVCSLLFLLTSNRVFVVSFVAAFAEALADTTASGIGSLSDKAYDPFRMRPCRAGLSGGMSLIGTMSSIVGAVVISLIAYAFGMLSIIESVIVILTGFLGGIFDSLLGSLVQVKYRCTVCDEITEKNMHCNAPTIKHSGIRFVDNNFVNFMSTVFASVLASVLFII